VEDQRRFPLQIATTLSQQFAQHGLQFFKVNKTVTHVWVARPKYLDLETTPVSDGIKRIVDFINSQKKCTRRDLVEPSRQHRRRRRQFRFHRNRRKAPNPRRRPSRLTRTHSRTNAVISDLHWLIHQGHVIEFATTGILETAKSHYQNRRRK